MQWARDRKQTHQVTCKILPRRYFEVGLVIGKGGSHVVYFQHQSGAAIHIARETDEIPGGGYTSPPGSAGAAAVTPDGMRRITLLGEETPPHETYNPPRNSPSIWRGGSLNFWLGREGDEPKRIGSDTFVFSSNLIRGFIFNSAHPCITV